MAKLDLTFINQDDNSEMDVELQDNLTARQIIEQLLREAFIANGTYGLARKGANTTIPEGMTLAQAGVQNGEVLVVQRSQRAGRV